MTAKRNGKEKDAIDLMLDQIDFHGMTKDELAGENGLLRQITRRFYERALEAEMDTHLGFQRTTKPATIKATDGTATRENP